MLESQIRNEYFGWIFNLVCGDRKYDATKYTKLLDHLFGREFIYILQKDGNRAEDGIYLRYRFGYSFGYANYEIENYLDTTNCSILEMMVALALRCEEQIMDDPDYGNRTSKWFWIMIENLGFSTITNNRYDPEYVDRILDDFLNRQYDKYGHGALFTLKHPISDMAEIEIWYQLCSYLNEYII